MVARTGADILNADKLLFPGVGSFGSAMQRLHDYGYADPLRHYLEQGRPFLGICLGLQTLFESSEESPGVPGLGIIPGRVGRFDDSRLSVPHIGWNGIKARQASPLFSGLQGDEKFYFVHSYRAIPARAPLRRSPPRSLLVPLDTRCRRPRDERLRFFAGEAYQPPDGGGAG